MALNLRINFVQVVLISLLATLFPTPPAFAQDEDIPTEGLSREETLLHTPGKPEHSLVEFFTSDTLRSGEWMLGTIANYGITDNLMVGFDIVSSAIGAPNFNIKSFVWSNEKHSVSAGLQLSYLDRKTVLWGSMREHFDELSVRAIKPSVSYTRRVSPRLRIHSSYSVPFAKIEAELSEEGKRKLFEAKYPNGNFETGEKGKEESSTSGNQAAKANDQSGTYAQRTLQVSSITGIASDIFQITGEILRDNGNIVLVTSRIEQTQIKKLKADTFRLTLAQQWVWDHFRFRLGLGLQYLVLSGDDLDGEKLNEAGVLPASDINFYWRF